MNFYANIVNTYVNVKNISHKAFRVSIQNGMNLKWFKEVNENRIHPIRSTFSFQIAIDLFLSFQFEGEYKDRDKILCEFYI